ncbi:MAG TPA: ETX/MTX2 family pore-forming toxin [Thermoanaerobaculia bacterium]|nr:ETX/MTX2 family pore-forming toxin [Thermoanaerobaculia bacterium]
MANLGQYLTTNQFLGTGDILTSANGLFFAIMQSDGNFCVYHGTGPANNLGYLWGSQATASGGNFFAVMQGDGNFVVYKGTGPGNNEGYVWATLNQSQPQGSYFVIMQNDGNLCCYSGSGPADNTGYVWCSGKTDPIVGVAIGNIVYNVAEATIEQTVPADLYMQDVSNGTAIPQTSTISGSESVSETSGWSDSLAISVGVSASFQTDIPFVADAEVEVSVDVTNTYTWNGSVTTSKVWGFSAPVTVPPGDTYKVVVSVTMSTISVPYTLTGTATLRSGLTMPITIDGTYTGTNSHDLAVAFGPA